MNRFVLLLLAGLLAFPSTVLAEGLRIVTIDLPPYGFVTKGMISGLCYELGDIIAREAGLEAINRIRPLARGVEDIVDGTADMIIMIPSEEILHWADNLGSILPLEVVIFGRVQTPLRTLRDVRGKVVAHVRGAGYQDSKSRELGIVPYPSGSYEQSLKMLLSKRVDAVMGPKMGLQYTARRLGLPRRAFGPPLVVSVAQGSVFLSKRVKADVAARVAEAVERILRDGTMQRLLDKYSL